MQKQLGLRYIYDDSTPKTEDMPGWGEDIKPTDLAGLPQEWLAKFYRAVLEGDLEKMQEAIEEIYSQNEFLANSMLVYVNSYNFEKLLSLVEPYN